jgi:riboflavin synthase
MFTGIVTDMGRVRKISGEDVRRFEIECSYDASTIDLGASIAHAGACLTVVERHQQGASGIFSVEVSPETLRLTTLGDLTVGDAVNLERALKIGEELGGHIVTGHVDGVGTCAARRTEGDWLIFTIKPPSQLNQFIAKKGSITVDGVSLTVNEVSNDSFDLMIIPHTAQQTTLGKLQAGERVNLEIDPMARYAARLSQFSENPG